MGLPLYSKQRGHVLLLWFELCVLVLMIGLLCWPLEGLSLCPDKPFRTRPDFGLTCSTHLHVCVQMLLDLQWGYVLVNPSEIENIISQSAFNASDLPNIIA